MPWHEFVFTEVCQTIFNATNDSTKIVKTPNEPFENRTVLVFNPELLAISEIIDKWKIIHLVKKYAWIGHFHHR